MLTVADVAAILTALGMLITAAVTVRRSLREVKTQDISDAKTVQGMALEMAEMLDDQLILYRRRQAYLVGGILALTKQLRDNRIEPCWSMNGEGGGDITPLMGKPNEPKS